MGEVIGQGELVPQLGTPRREHLIRSGRDVAQDGKCWQGDILPLRFRGSAAFIPGGGNSSQVIGVGGFELLHGSELVEVELSRERHEALQLASGQIVWFRPRQMRVFGVGPLPRSTP